MNNFLSIINDIVWSTPFIIICICAGLYFSFRTKFLQVRYFRHMLTLLFKEGSSDKGVSPFQAFAIAIAGRVGVGNIAGVATAIAMGGPGAVFWMWVIAFLGSATAFIEACLAQVYKLNINGEYRGGPAYYFEKALKYKWYAYIFAFAALVSGAYFLPAVQANAIAESVSTAWGVDKLYVGIAICILLSLTVFGSAKKIGKVAEIIVPFMAGAYILLALIIIGMNIHEVPEVFSLIIKSAFNFESTYAGMFGAAVAWGVKRGLYSNEAGQGTAPQAAAAAATSHPVKQGLVQAFSVYVDTLLVCTATACMILFTNSYNVYNEAGEMIVANIPNTEKGAAYTTAAIGTYFPGFAEHLVAIALSLFAFTTIMAYYFIAESNLLYITKRAQAMPIWILRLIILYSIINGCISTSHDAWTIGDIGVGLMSWVNILGILFLGKIAFKCLDDYDKQRKAGLDPTFDPKKLNIHNTSEW